jgi:hypothetical protein
LCRLGLDGCALLNPLLFAVIGSAIGIIKTFAKVRTDGDAVANIDRSGHDRDHSVSHIRPRLLLGQHGPLLRLSNDL